MEKSYVSVSCRFNEINIRESDNCIVLETPEIYVSLPLKAAEDLQVKLSQLLQDIDLRCSKSK